MTSSKSLKLLTNTFLTTKVEEVDTQSRFDVRTTFFDRLDVGWASNVKTFLQSGSVV